MTEVIIGIDPHKGSHTAVVLDRDERILGRLRVKASATQLDQLRRWAAPWPERTWAIEGARGLGRLLAQQLVASGEHVVDVQPKLAARVRLLNSGQVNKNDPNDARSVAVAALRAPSTPSITAEDDTAAMKMWARRYRDLGSLWTQSVCRQIGDQVVGQLEAGGVSRGARIDRREQLDRLWHRDSAREPTGHEIAEQRVHQAAFLGVQRPDPLLRAQPLHPVLPAVMPCSALSSSALSSSAMNRYPNCGSSACTANAALIRCASSQSRGVTGFLRQA